MKLRIGLPLIGGAAWHGGVTYLDAIVRAFRVLPLDEQPELWLIVGMQGDVDVSMHQELISLVDGTITFNVDPAKYEHLQSKNIVLTDLLQVDKFVDFIFPLNCDSLPGFASASWIPDLQHKYLPQFFAQADIDSRNNSIDFVVDTADVVILSSECTKKDFLANYSSFSGHLEVVHFYSRFDADVFALDPVSIAKTYALPDRFIICCNQFWQHKNHDNLFRALAKTKSSVHLVCTGGHADYRNVEWFPKLRRLLKELEIESRVTVLGLIPRSDQLQLIRRSIGVIQPSLFEGWSTVMEDARGLGKRVLASNIPVHLEQAVCGAEYFDPLSVDGIAALIDHIDNGVDEGPHLSAEAIARKKVGEMQLAASLQLLSIAQKSVKINHQRSESPSLRKNFVREARLTARLILANSDLANKQHVIDTMPAYGSLMRLLEEKEQAIRERERIIEEKERVIQEKERVINAQVEAIKVYRLVLWPLRPFFPLLRLSARAARRCTEILRPRLGNLRQYSPRSLSKSLIHIGVPQLTVTPKFSIVTPSFQQGEYLERTIVSVLSQGYPNIEYFVQDGGSNDNTIDVLKRYQGQLSGWLSEKDGGQSQAINLGFMQTNGEIMGWLNSDDLLLPGALVTIADYFNRHPAVDVVYGNRLLIDANDMEIGRWILPGHDGAVLSWSDYVPQETMFWRRRIWDKVGGQIDESFRFAMDWDLLVRFRDAEAKFAHIPQFLGAFRIHEHQKTTATINDIGHQEMDRIRSRLLGRVPDRKEIRKAALPYLLKHVAVDMLYRVKTRLGLQF